MMLESREKVRTLRILITGKKVRDKMEELNIKHSDIIQDLENLDQIKLFYYKSEEDEKNRQFGRIALPFCNGRQVLLLVPPSAKEDDYFRAISFRYDKEVSTDSWCYPLPPGTRCKLYYSNDEIKKDQDGGDFYNPKQLFEKIAKESYQHRKEERKWKAYLKLYRTILMERQLVQFVIRDIEFEDEQISAQLSEQLEIEKKNILKGKELIFSIIRGYDPMDANKELGKVKKFIEKEKIEIKLDDNFVENFKQELKDKFSHTGNKKYRIKFLSAKEFGESNNGSCQEEIIDDEAGLLFRAEAYKEKAGESYEEKAHAEKVVRLCVNEDTIRPLGLYCATNIRQELLQVERMDECFKELRNEQPHIWNVLSENDPPKELGDLPEASRKNIHNSKGLNDEQKKAVEGALRTQDLFLIWGPPGTGKTTVIKEVAKYESAIGNKTLIASQANLAVDNALARLHNIDSVYPLRVARDNYELEGEDKQKIPLEGDVGSVAKFFLDYWERQIKQKPDEEEYSDIRKQLLDEIVEVRGIIKKEEKHRSEEEKDKLYQLAAIYRTKVNVVGATLMVCGRSKGNKRYVMDCANIEAGDKFDTVIIDEVSKATPPELFIPMAVGKKIILVGDHKQLPPMSTILSDDNGSEDYTPIEEWAEMARVDPEELDLDNTLFERLWNRYKEEYTWATAKLRVQYRMHKEIQGLIEQFYEEDGGETLICGLTDEDMKHYCINHDFFCGEPCYMG